MMADERSTVKAAFFDIDALGSLRFSAPPARQLGLSVYPYLVPVLEQLSALEVRLGIICSMPGVNTESLSAALAAAGINAFFDQDLLIFAADGVGPGPRAPFYIAPGRASPAG